MKTIPEIKALCQEVISLGEEATPGPWVETPLPQESKYHYAVIGAPGSVETVARMALIDAGPQQVATNARLIAAARTFTPQAAKALLECLQYIEGDGVVGSCRHSYAQEYLGEICKFFP